MQRLDTAVLTFVLFAVLVVAGQASAQRPRVVQIVNQCRTDYWMTATAGAAPYNVPGKPKCHSDADCLAGAACLTSNGICFWRVPTPLRGNFRIPAGASNAFVFPYVDNGNGVFWSGNIGFCQPGTCGPSSSPAECDARGCGVYAGPSNIAEFTMVKQGSDYYDISIIGGVNVPMAFGPSSGGQYSPVKPYVCGTAGATRNPTGQWVASWNFTAPSVYHRWVTSGGPACTSDAQCNTAAGQVCGLTNNVGSTPQFCLTCGSHLGYWTADAVCGSDPSFGAPFNCRQPLSPPNSGLVLDNLYGCTGVGSCYQPNPPNSCCGCVNWNALLGPNVSPNSTQQCGNSNPNWLSQVLPQLDWLKRGCPSCYTYPYDDMSSTFVCSSGSGFNEVDYKITLCP